MGRRICSGGRRTNGRSLCVRESSSQSAAREEKKKDKVRGRFWNLVESREEKRKERMKISVRVWWRKIKRKEGEKKKETYGW